MTCTILLTLAVITALTGPALRVTGRTRTSTPTLLLLGAACALAAAAEAVRGDGGLAVALAVWAVCFPAISDPVSRLRFSYSTARRCDVTSIGAHSGEQVPCVRGLMHYGFHRDAHGVQWRTRDLRKD